MHSLFEINVKLVKILVSLLPDVRPKNIINKKEDNAPTPLPPSFCGRLGE